MRKIRSVMRNICVQETHQARVTKIANNFVYVYLKYIKLRKLLSSLYFYADKVYHLIHYINRIMSEELLSPDRRVEKNLTPPGFELLISRFITICTTDSAISPCFLLC